jgi:phage terminase large subunit-like protein/DNA-directed RNA polymerase subunit RPC12/RpoP
MTATLADARLERLRKLRELQQELKRRHDEADGAIKRPWKEIARPEQLPPPGDWMTWLILAGRGWGKSRTAAEWAAERGRRYPGSRIALVGKTFADARDTMLEGESGLIACFNRDEFRNHSEDDGYNRSIGEIRLANGTHYKTYSAEKPWRLRGPQHHAAWCDEAAFWQDASRGLISDTTWSNLVITLRLPKKPGWDGEYQPQVVVATTPRPVALLRSTDPDPARSGLMQRETTIITRGRTMDNIANLSEAYKDNVIAPLMGTRLGRQELDAEILEDMPGALWKREWIDRNRVSNPALVPDLIRVVVGVDPSVTDGESSAQTGIVVAGAANNGRGYVLGDFTLRGSPMETMSKAISVFHEFKADRVIGEVNQGGDYLRTLIKTIDPNIPFQAVRATRGKAIRAEPISSLYEQNRISHVGTFSRLEDEMCSWLPTDPVSPDMMDAAVWALWGLHDLIGGSFLSAYGVIKCTACKHPFSANDSGTKKPRLACPKCGAKVATDELHGLQFPVYHGKPAVWPTSAGPEVSDAIPAASFFKQLVDGIRMQNFGVDVELKRPLPLLNPGSMAHDAASGSWNDNRTRVYFKVFNRLASWVLEWDDIGQSRTSCPKCGTPVETADG